MVDQKFEIEVELQDKASEVVQGIAKSVSEVIKQMGELGKASSGGSSGVTHTVKSVKDLGDKSKDANKELSGLSAILVPLSGAAGIAFSIGSGLVAAATAMDKVAGSRLRLQNLSTDIGITVDQMSIMSRTFEKMGMGSEEAASRVAQIGAAVKEMGQHGAGSQLFRDLAERGFADFARTMYRTVQAGDGYKAIQDFIAEANRLEKVEGPAAAARFTDTLNGMSDGIRKTYVERSKHVQAARQINIETARELRKAFEENKVAVWNVFAPLVDEAMQALNRYGRAALLSEALKGIGQSAGAYMPWFFDKKPLSPITDPLLLDPPSALKRKGHKFEFEKDEETKEETNSTLEKIRDSIKNLFGATPKQHGGSVEAGQNYLVGEAGPELYTGGGESMVVGEGGPSIIQLGSPGMITAGGENGGFPQFVPNIHTPQVAMPPFEERFGDWDSKGFGDRFGDWNRSSVEDRFGDWTTRGGGTRPTRGGSTPNWKGGDWQGDGVSPSLGPDMSSIDRRELDIMLSTEIEGSPSLNADISFKNVPPGVTTKADGEGFDNFKVNKSRALEDA